MKSLPVNNKKWLMKEVIKNGGTISFCSYMNLVLNDPINGYYGSGKAVLGPEGDFVTSSSLSDDFAFLLAKQIEGWLMDFKAKLIGNKKLCVLEFGAGDGSLLKGIIDYFFKSNKKELNVVSFIIIEPNEGMIIKQKQKLIDHLQVGVDIRWKDLNELEDNSLNGVVIANEVLDALPVERIVYIQGNLYRQGVTLDKETGNLFFDKLSIPKKLEEIIFHTSKRSGIEIPPKDVSEGWTTEIHVNNSIWLKDVYKKLDNGILLIIDYAKEAEKYYSSRNKNGTLMSYKNQRIIDSVLESPGSYDLTAHICIETLIYDAESNGFETIGISKQGEALLLLGLAERLYEIQNEFKNNLSEALSRREALLRLVDPICLGDFKWFIFKKFNQGNLEVNTKCIL